MEQAMTSPPFDMLPDEMVDHIFAKVTDMTDCLTRLATLGRVCRRWRSVSAAGAHVRCRKEDDAIARDHAPCLARLMGLCDGDKDEKAKIDAIGNTIWLCIDEGAARCLDCLLSDPHALTCVSRYISPRNTMVCRAMRHKHRGVLSVLHDHMDIRKVASTCAISMGRDEIYKWLLDQGIVNYDGDAYSMVFHDRNTLLGWLMKRPEWTSFRWSPRLYVNAVEWHSQRMIDMLRKYGCPLGRLNVDLYRYLNRAPMTMLDCALHAGFSTDLVQWLRERGASWTSRSFEAAINSCSLDMVRYVHANACPWDASSCSSALGENHVNIIEWATLAGLAIDHDHVTYGAITNDQRAMIEWLDANGLLDAQRYEHIASHARIRPHCRIASWVRERAAAAVE